MHHSNARASSQEVRVTPPVAPPPPHDAFLDFDPILPGWPEVSEADASRHEPDRAGPAHVLPVPPHVRGGQLS